MDNPDTVEIFRSELDRTGQEYCLLDRPAADCAMLQFTGPFQGREVIWNATVVTLARYNRRHDGDPAPAARRQFIDIAPGDGSTRDILIGLDLGAIDHPVLLKTIIMVRKYKRLRVGRHEFGGAGGT